LTASNAAHSAKAIFTSNRIFTIIPVTRMRWIYVPVSFKEDHEETCL
jgi:hypothetical protein